MAAACATGTSTRLKKEELLSHAGDTQINVTLPWANFAPVQRTRGRVKELTSSQLRGSIACRPGSFMDLLCCAAWRSGWRWLARVYTDKAGKLPFAPTARHAAAELLDERREQSDSAGSDLGKSSRVNVSSMTKESVLHKILRQGVAVAGIASPLMGFPAMSLPAARTFTAIYSLLEERASFFMSSGLVDAASTQQSMDRPGFPPQFIPLKTGNYVMIPRQHTDLLAEHLPYLEFNQGYLIDKRKQSNLPVDQQAPQTIPDLTYVSMKLDVSAIRLPIPGLTEAEAPAAAKTGKKK